MSLVLRCISIPMLQIFQIALNNCLGLSFVFLVPSPYLKGQKDTRVAFSVNLYYARSSPQVWPSDICFGGNIGQWRRNTAVWSDIRLVLKPWLLEWEKSPSDMCIQITAFGESWERLKKKNGTSFISFSFRGRLKPQRRISGSCTYFRTEFGQWEGHMTTDLTEKQGDSLKAML